MAFIANYAEFIGQANSSDEAKNASDTAKYIDKKIFGSKQERQRIFEEVRLSY